MPKCSSFSPVSTTIGMLGARSLMRWSASIPLASGRFRSSSTQSGLASIELAFGVGHRLRPLAADVGGSVGDELFDQHRVCPVVLDKKDRQPVLSLCVGTRAGAGSS